MKMNPIKFLVSNPLRFVTVTSLLLTVADARTWTSADGTKSFEAEIKSYNPRNAVVTVTLANGKTMLFEQDKLSAADIAYLKDYFEEQRAKAAPSSAPAVNLKDLPNVWPPTNEKPYNGKKLKAVFASDLKSLKEEISRALPKVGSTGFTDLENASKATAEVQAKADAAQKELGQIGGAKALIDHAKGKWIGGANKAVAAAQAALKEAKTPAEKAAAKDQLASAQKNLAEGEAALKERTALYEKAKTNEAALKSTHEQAQAALAQAKTRESDAANKLIGSLNAFLTSSTLDGKLAKAFVLTAATPDGLADFAEQSSENVEVVQQLLSDGALMMEMMEAGGARFGQFGEAMKIFSVIQKVSPQSKDGVLRRLALATSLEHARPVDQKNSPNVADQSPTVHPVKRYLHYEKAFLAGELDLAFKSLTAWEMRFVVNSEDPDEIHSWGREMLRTYRPDYMSGDYGWRYVSSVKGEVPYGSQNVQYDDPSNHLHQNIIRNGGVCGRRAFFGRFILRTFGIPTWGVTQKAHAALSHWTPKGWVVNLGAGYPHSWWDKDDVKLSGSQFLLETQARAHAKEYLPIVRSQMVSRILGEKAYNDRSNEPGGDWSKVALHQSRILASSTSALGPLGQELAEANEEEQKLQSEDVEKADLEIQQKKDGGILIPAVAHKDTSGKSATMRSYSGGMQIHGFGGFKAEYQVNAPRSGNYLLNAKVATAQTGQNFLFTVNNGQPIEQPAPYTIGLWETTKDIPVTLKSGPNNLTFEITQGSRGVTIKEFTLTPAK